MPVPWDVSEDEEPFSFTTRKLGYPAGAGCIVFRQSRFVPTNYHKPHRFTHIRTDAPFGGIILEKLESLTVSHLDILSGRGEQLLDVLKGRRDRGVGLKRLVVRSCRVHEDEYRSRLGQLVEEVEWDGVIAVGSSYRGTENGPDTDELEDNLW